MCQGFERERKGRARGKRKTLTPHPPPTTISQPLPAIYNVVVQELLVQAHLAVHNINYAYSPLTALGAVAALDAVLDGLPGDEGATVFTAFTSSLGMDPAKARSDAAALTAWAKEVGAGGLTSSDGVGGAAMADLSSRAAAGTLHYNRFMAVGLFKLLEAAGVKDPKALESVVAAAGVPAAAVSRDLQTYKAALSKLAASKELMRELLERERKKAAERAAEKAGAAASGGVAEGGAGGDAVPAPNAA